MVVGVGPEAASAATAGCGTLAGDGTTTSPCLITSNRDLDEFGSLVGSDTDGTTYATQAYRLTANLDYAQNPSTAGTWPTVPTTFKGVFDGSGHTIANVTLESATGFFGPLAGATVENLTLANVTGTSSLLAPSVTGGTVTGVALANVTATGTSPVAGGFVAGFVGSATGSATFSNDSLTGTITNLVETTPVNKTGVAGFVGTAAGPVTIRDCYVSATFSIPKLVSAGSAEMAGGLVGWVNTTASPGVVMTDNVVAGTFDVLNGSSNTTETHTAAVVGLGRATGATAYTGWSTANNLVSVRWTRGGHTNRFVSTETQAPDGTPVSAATLADETTYRGTDPEPQTDPTTNTTYRQLGWNVDQPVTPATTPGTGEGAWAWDATNGVPVVAHVPVITVGHGTVTFEHGAAPDDGEVLAAIAPSATTVAGVEPTFTVDTGAVDWTTDGSYTATVTASAAGWSSTTEVTVKVVTPVITVLNTTVYFPAHPAAQAEDVLRATGAVLTDGAGTTLPGTLTVDLNGGDMSTPGRFTATISGVDRQGNPVAPVDVTVVVNAGSVSVATDTVKIAQAKTAPTTAALVDYFGASLPAGSTGNVVFDTTGVLWDVPGSYAVTIGDDKQSDAVTPRNATIVIEPTSAVIATTSAAVTVYVNSPAPTSDDLVAQSGARLTDAAGNPIDGTVTAALPDGGIDTREPGTYTVTLNGTVRYTLTGTATEPTPVTLVATPVQLTVNVVWATQGVTPGTPTIAGTAQVGSPLTADPGFWLPAGTPSFQWLRNESPIAGATDATYVPAPADVGQSLTVVVTENGVPVESSPVVVAPGVLIGTPPAISGTPTVGKTLTAVPAWAPSSATTFYQWLRDGAAIPGATAATYTLQDADADHQVSVRVVGDLTGYGQATLTSQPVVVGRPEPTTPETEHPGVVEPAALTTAAPTVTGTAKVGAVLTAHPGDWTAGTTFSYQWTRDGAAIPGATRATYTAVPADAGAQVAVTVTGTKPGYTEATERSAAVRVAKGTLRAATPRIKGTARVGKTLTAVRGSWTRGTRLTYRWYANGKEVARSAGKPLRLTKALRGKKITLKVTGARAGYVTTTKRSAATKRVAG